MAREQNRMQNIPRRETSLFITTSAEPDSVDGWTFLNVTKDGKKDEAAEG
jgi:hypothetical protein